MDSQSYNGTRRERARRGVSLIEVLVVLVILVTGILTIIRLFPSGFFSIQSTGNAALADGLGSAALDLGAQGAANLPEAILPDDMNTALYSDSLTNAMMTSAQYSNYDPDNPNNLENARVILNETITIPTLVNKQSVYVVNYGPVVMPNDPLAANASTAQYPNYFTVNSPNWSVYSGNYAPPPVAGAGAPASTDIPQDTLVPGREQLLVDLVNKRIAVPYAAYTPDGMTSMTSGTPAVTVQNANSYPQKMVLTITCTDGNVYTKYLNILPGTPKNSANPYAPFGSDNQTYLPDSTVSGGSGYQGGWFDPTADYQDSPPGTNPSSTEVWASVTLYRPYNGVLTGNISTPLANFSNDPYEFKLLAANIATSTAAGTGSNPGSVGFNPKAAAGVGAQTRKVKISYIVSSWSILREDHDVPALTGTGSTFVVRTAVPNLKLAGSANPDNTINPGIAGSNYSLVIMDLDTGKIIAPLPATSPYYDPTNGPDSPINNEDLNGTMTGPVSPIAGSPSYINISYSLGRMTFSSNAFGDNSVSNGSGTAPAHRIRIYYTADLDWTVAVQKPAAYFQQLPTSPVGSATGTTALAAFQYAYDSADAFVYFARCNAGKTVEIDGTYTSGGTTQGFSDTVAIDPTLYALGDTALRVDLTDATKFDHPVPKNAAVTFTAVRGLSARAVVAWKERNQYKVHSVDAVLNRTP